jgi:hypothetical protein
MTFFVHDDDAVVMTCGKRFVKARSLVGYVLAEYVEGDDADPTRTDCVDKCIMNALATLPSTTPIPRNQTAYNRELCPPRPSQQRQLHTCDLGKTLSPLYERFVGVALLGIRPCNLTGDHVSAGTSVPYPLRGSTQGCVAEYHHGTGKRPNLLPLTLTVLLTDLTKSQRSLGLMTQTRAGFMTRDPRGEDVV